jgi:hypothetical protein
VAAGGLDLHENPVASLVNKPATAVACQGMSMKRVVVGHPDKSLLYLKIISKIDGTEPPCGDGMPSGVDLAPLTPEEAERVRSWIAAGAPDD